MIGGPAPDAAEPRKRRTEPPRTIVITCPTFEPGFRASGPVRSVKQIIDAAPAGLELLLVTRDRDLGDRRSYPGLSGRWVPNGRAVVFYLDPKSPVHWYRLVRALRRRRIALLYVNSLWNAGLSLAPLLLAWSRLLPAGRVLIAPRGELSPGALGLKSFKKRAFLLLWSRMLGRLRPIWHASTALEAAEIRSISRFAVHQVLTSSDQPVLPDRVGDTAPRTRAGFVYIGRISPKKNIALIIRALALVQSATTLHVYGPVEDTDYWAECESLAARLPAHVQVRYEGELHPDEVVETFARYDAFVFPTRGENFGHVIAESLAAACPVICSTFTPWTDVLDAGGGAVVRDLSPSGLAAVLDRWAAMTPDEIVRGHEAAHSAYLDWQAHRDRTNILDLALNARHPGGG